jgi:penicillin amidase
LVSEPVKGRAYSMRWTGAEGTGLFAALHGVNEAKTENDVKAAAKLLVAPCLRIGWAGPESRHGIVFAGLAPIRCRESDGISPMPAWTGAHDWIAAVPLETLLKQGAADLCVTTNEKPAAAQGLFLGSYWQNDGRAAQ